MKPHWETKHDWWIEDFAFEMVQQRRLRELLVKHPDDGTGGVLRDMNRALERKFGALKRKYKSIYGRFPNLRGLREEVEEGFWDDVWSELKEDDDVGDYYRGLDR